MGVVAHACISSTQQVGVGGSGVHSPLWLYKDPGIHRALSQKEKEEGGREEERCKIREEGEKDRKLREGG